MTISQRIHAQVALVVLIVVCLAAANWVLQPAKASSWLIAIGTMAGAWLVVAAIGSARRFEQQSAAERGFLVISVAAAGALIAASLGKHLADRLGFAGGETLDRALGVGAGLVLLLLGNTMPKILAPLGAGRCTPKQAQSIQRLGGWTFALAGLVCIGASLVLPVAMGKDVSEGVTIAAVVIVVLRCAWAFLAPRVRSSPTGS